MLVENLDSQDSLDIFSVQTPSHEDNMKAIIEKLDNTLLSQYNNQGINIYCEQKNGIYTINVPLITEQLFQTQMIIQVNPIKYNISFFVFLINQEGRIIIKNKAIKIQLGKYMLRVNNGLRVGTFFIDPIKSYIGAKFIVQMSNQQFQKMFYSSTDVLKQFLQTMITTIQHTIRFHIYRILVLADLISFTKFNYLEENLKTQAITNYRKFPQDVISILQRITKLSININQKFDDEESDQKSQIYQIINKIQKPLQGLPILTQIDIFNSLEFNKDIQKINCGGFCEIGVKEVQYQLTNNVQNDNRVNLINKRYLVIKRSKKMEQGDPQIQNKKIKNEFEILQVISEHRNNQLQIGWSPFIAQFYYSTSNTEILMMERYFNSSLDYFLKKHEEQLSLYTKLTIAYDIAQGLRYIHSYDIVHMDIKPSNILISKNYQAKITDFGESINLKKEYIDNNFGMTLPYVPPEYFNNSQKITTAYDIYSFGVTLYEILFNRQPIDYSKDKIDVLIDKLKKQTYSIRHDTENQKNFGPKIIIKQLSKLCIQCLQPDPFKRPNIDKIVIILKDSLTFLERMY